MSKHAKKIFIAKASLIRIALETAVEFISDRKDRKDDDVLLLHLAALEIGITEWKTEFQAETAQTEAEYREMRREQRERAADRAEEQQREMREKLEELKVYEYVVRGKCIGDFWYSEFENYRRDGAFDAALFKRIIQYGIPPKPMRVRDYVDARDLESMITAAREEADLA